MATAATAPARRRPSSSVGKAARPHRAGAGARQRNTATATAKSPRKAAGSTAKAVERALPGKAGTLVTMWRLARLGRRVVKRRLPAAALALHEATESLREVAESARDRGIQGLGDHRVQDLTRQLRRVPVQLSIDVAVPVEVAYDEWMRLDSLPEGGHRVHGIRRRGERLVGEFGSGDATRDWKAEVRDERRDESFAWRSRRGSDVAGLVTFHRLGPRLTRLELSLDIVPVSTGEGLALALRLSDRITDAELRRFKARVETISPDAYPDRVKDRARRRDSKRSGRTNRGPRQGRPSARKTRTQSKED